MGKQRVQDLKPPRAQAGQEWLDAEIADQRLRYEAIAAETKAATPAREEAYAGFLEIVQRKGFNVTGDVRRVIPADEVPEKPDRPDAMRVVW
jgi:hypothetical protein